MTIETRRPGLGAALAAGSIAIVLNTLVLKAADLISLPTGNGVLLRLIAPWLAPLLRGSGVAGAWAGVGGPTANSPGFQTGFHLAVGMLMAIAYGLALEPRLPGRPVVKGLLYALAVWLLNAFAVLPATGVGIAGAAHLTVAGIIWFAAAHTLFFVALAVLYADLRTGRTVGSDAPSQRRAQRSPSSPVAPQNGPSELERGVDRYRSA